MPEEVEAHGYPENMIESVLWNGVFSVYTNPGYSTEELNELTRAGIPFTQIDGLELIETRPNLLMAAQKLAMANQVFPAIDKLVITSQSTPPVDTETSYSGTIYTTVAADEFGRSGNGNPYTVSWNLGPSTANGTWGSFILINSDGAMINRALANIVKATGSRKIVHFEGSVS